jgi:hypothetical protein
MFSLKWGKAKQPKRSFSHFLVSPAKKLSTFPVNQSQGSMKNERNSNFQQFGDQFSLISVPEPYRFYAAPSTKF